MYTPSAEILNSYAAVLVNFALHNGEGVRPGEVVWVRIPECAKPFYVPLRNTILKAGAHPFIQIQADDTDPASFFALANEEQLDFYPASYYEGLIKNIDHMIAILAEHNKYELEGIDPIKIMRQSKALRPYMKLREEKENAGKFGWTLGLYGTPAMAEDVGMSEEEYWQEIIEACYLDEPDPVTKWREVMTEINRVRTVLNALSIDHLTVIGEDINLTIGLDKNRQWLGGSGQNIPSFEVFISPDWRRTEGTILCNQPLYRYGNRVKDIMLTFEQGKVVKASASENEKLLLEMIAQDNADKIGEFSLTDTRLSRITKPMGETLFDENMGGPFGNTHIALGNAYKDSYPGDVAAVTEAQWKEMGYNDSVVHTDIISTTDRTVTAYLENGERQVIYEKGKFTL